MVLRSCGSKKNEQELQAKKCPLQTIETNSEALSKIVPKKRALRGN
jgi:hypothetical protein